MGCTWPLRTFVLSWVWHALSPPQLFMWRYSIANHIWTATVSKRTWICTGWWNRSYITELHGWAIWQTLLYESLVLKLSIFMYFHIHAILSCITKDTDSWPSTYTPYITGEDVEWVLLLGYIHRTWALHGITCIMNWLKTKWPHPTWLFIEGT